MHAMMRMGESCADVGGVLALARQRALLRVAEPTIVCWRRMEDCIQGTWQSILCSLGARCRHTGWHRQRLLAVTTCVDPG